MKHIKDFFKFIFSFQFSKLLIIFETILVAYTTYKGFYLAGLCIVTGFDGNMPWIAGLVSAAFAAYGTSTAFYYNKSKAEQVRKIELLGDETTDEASI